MAAQRVLSEAGRNIFDRACRGEFIFLQDTTPGTTIIVLVYGGNDLVNPIRGGIDIGCSHQILYISLHLKPNGTPYTHTFAEKYGERYVEVAEADVPAETRSILRRLYEGQNAVNRYLGVLEENQDLQLEVEGLRFEAQGLQIQVRALQNQVEALQRRIQGLQNHAL